MVWSIKLAGFMQCVGYKESSEMVMVADILPIPKDFKVSIVTFQSK